MARDISLAEMQKYREVSTTPKATATEDINKRFGTNVGVSKKDLIRTEGKIAERKPSEEMAGDIFSKASQKKPIEGAGRAALSGLLLAGVPIERGVSAVAGGAGEVQQGLPLPARQAAMSGGAGDSLQPGGVAEFNPRTPEQSATIQMPVKGARMAGPAGVGQNIAENQPQMAQVFKQAGERVMQGIKGERVERFGDLIRREDLGGMNFMKEPAAVAADLFGGWQMTKAAGATLGANKAIGKMVTAWQERPVTNNPVILNQVKTIANKVKDIRSETGKAVESALNSVNPAQPLSAEQLPTWGRILDTMKTAGVNAVKKAKDPIIANVQKVRDLIQKKVPQKVWDGVQDATPEQAQVMQLWHKTSELIADGNPALTQAWGSYKNVMDTVRGVNKQLYANGQVTASKVINVFKSLKDAKAAGEQAPFIELQELWAQAPVVIKNIVKYNQTQAIKEGVSRTAQTAGRIVGFGAAAGGARTALETLDEGM